VTNREPSSVFAADPAFRNTAKLILHKTPRTSKGNPSSLAPALVEILRKPTWRATHQRRSSFLQMAAPSSRSEKEDVLGRFPKSPGFEQNHEKHRIRYCWTVTRSLPAVLSNNATTTGSSISLVAGSSVDKARLDSRVDFAGFVVVVAGCQSLLNRVSDLHSANGTHESGCSGWVNTATSQATNKRIKEAQEDVAATRVLRG
jgi:hypothetical protein